MNELEVYTEQGPNSGFRTISVTDGKHPYLSAWWPPGHIIGYEHSFTHTIYDFVRGVSEGKSPRPELRRRTAESACPRRHRTIGANGTLGKDH